MPAARHLPVPALALALAASLFAGCATPVETNSPTADAAASDGDAAADSSIAVVSDGSLEPDPDQLAAGVPYLRFRVEVGDSPARGPADAPVTIVMFSDFECAYCDEAFHTVAELQDEYPDQIRFVYKALPLARHQNAMEAALVGHSAQAQGKFWEFHDLVFSGRGIDPGTIEAYARQVGLDLDRVADELESLEYAPEVRKDLRVAKRLKLRSTPVFFINGRMLPGARPKHIFRTVIDEELSLAERLADEGVGPAQLYDYATQWGYTAIVYEDEQAELDEDTVYPVPIGDSPVRGRADAPITIVAFTDFQCPYCARGHALMEELRELYGDDIRFVFKHFPLPGHPLAVVASRGAFVAEDAGKFWAYHDAIFARGPRFTADDVLEVGVELGLSPAELERALTGHDHDEAIQADIELGLRLKVSGTPAYFINGRPIVGLRPLMDFRMLIAEEFERVEQAKAKGIPADQVYEYLTK